MIILKANSDLKKVFLSLTKTIWKDVEWNYLFVIEQNCLILTGERRSLIFDFERKKAESNLIEIDINPQEIKDTNNNEILTNVLDMTLYAFGKWGMIRGLKVDKDYSRLNAMFNGITKEVGIESAITKDNFRFYEEGRMLTFEDVVEKLVLKEKKADEQNSNDSTSDNSETKDSDEKKYSIGLWHNMQWHMQRYEFVKEKETKAYQGFDNEAQKHGLGNNFYKTNYICPKCSDMLYMAVYPPKSEVMIETDDMPEKNVYMARAYACNKCFSYFTPRPHKILMEGDIYELEIENDREAFEDYLELIGRNADNVSNSNFNEYESEYRLKKSQGQQELPMEYDNPKELEDEQLERIKLLMEDGFYPESETEKFYEKIKAENKKRKKNSLKNRFKRKNKETADKNSKERKNKENTQNTKNTKKTENTHNTAHIQKSSFKADKEILNEKSKDANNTEKNKELHMDITLPNLDITDFSLIELDKLKGIFDALLNNIYDEKTREKYIDTVRKTLRIRINSEYENKLGILENISADELKELKEKALNEPLLAEDIKEKLLNAINAILNRGKEKEWAKRASELKDSDYMQIIDFISEMKRDAPINVQKALMTFLDKIKLNAAKRETAQITKKMSLNLPKEDYERYKKQLRQYQEIDTNEIINSLEQKRAAAENDKITSFISGFEAKNRKSMHELFEQLKNQGFDEEYLKPHLDKIQDRLYDADKKAIDKICPEPADISFDDGIWAYEEIEKGVYLPELKKDILGKLDQRLYRLKMDEANQLIAKLKKDMASAVTDYSKIFFYDERKIRKNSDDDETLIIKNAIDGYASDRSRYEIPLIVVNMSKNPKKSKGFVLTPDHLFYTNNMDGALLEIDDIESIYSKKGLFGKGIYMDYDGKKEIKLCNTLNMAEYTEFARVLDEFVSYLQEKPKSRSIQYMVREKHAVKCCYRCGYTYQYGDVCPKCGSKSNS